MTSDPRGRRLTVSDVVPVMKLYRALDRDGTFPDDDKVDAHLAEILAHPGTSLFGTEVDADIVAMCTLHVLPNMTRSQRPYALIENVVTAPDMRGRGFARIAMETAISAAWAAKCYKVMLLSGSADGHGFYPRLGFDGDAKKAFLLRNPD